MRILTCVGDATSISAHGGLPYHLLDAGKRTGFIDAGWPLKPTLLNGRRLLWNARRLLTHGEYGGYQYTERFMRALVRQVPNACAKPDEILSIFPLLPAGLSHCKNVSIYIDATLTQNFKDYGIDKKVGRSLIAEALSREGEAYRDAARILCRSTFAAKSVVEIYGVDPEKVHIVPGGANIIDVPALPPYGPTTLPLKPIRLAFIGKDWRRKNLPFLLSVADTLQSRGIATDVVAAGFDPERGPKHSRLRAIGFIDKRTDIKAFIDFFRSCHFNCLFSIAEAFGLSNRESLRLGVPVLASNVGGIPDTMPDGCGHLFEADADASDVANMIEGYVRDTDRYWALRNTVAKRADEFTWVETVKKMQLIWAGSDAFSYRRAVGTRA